MTKEVRRLEFACYSANLTMSVVSALPPILFLTFRSRFGLSFSALGALVLINFFTQLIVDLVLSFFSHRIDLGKAVKSIPYFAAAGFLIYALIPLFFPKAAFLGLAVGTAVFAFASGLGEVLISPVIAALPSPDPDRAMSRLHSVFAWGCVAVVTVGTLFLALCPASLWFLLPLGFSLIPCVSAALFATSNLPEMEKPARVSGALRLLKNRKVWLSIVCIFLGGAAECTMAQWCSGYLEGALSIPKFWGDLFGVALFSVMLGLGRSLYGRFGSKIRRVILLGFLGCSLCYLTASLSSLPILGLAAAVLTGFCASMLWPGNLVVAAENVPAGGVFIYAILAAGGDLGASVGPQLVGVVTDLFLEKPSLIALADALSLSPQTLGLKAGLATGALFSLAGLFVSLILYRTKPEKG